MKIAIILSGLMTGGFIYACNVVMAQVNSLENFYGNIDQYAQTAVSTQSTTENPYVPQPLKDISNPTTASSYQSFGN